jgi:glycosyltransferase involved in cell wall biosynthesis
MKTLTVVCPVYNEEAVIRAFHAELASVLHGLAGHWRSTILYVVDRGSDRTAELLRGVAAADPAVRLILLSSRFGQQAALVAGLDHADADAVIMMDSDLQHPPTVIPALLAEHERGSDVVYTVRETSDQIPWLKRVSARWFYRLLNAVSDTPIHQGAADFRLISRRVLRVFQRQIGERTLFLRGLVSWVGFPSAPIAFRPARRPGGRTKYPLRRMLDFAAGGVVSFSRAPLRAALLAGASLAALALAAGAALLAAWAVGRIRPTGLHGVALLLVLLCGVQLLFLGVIGEYLGRVLDEVRGRPRYLVDERVNFPAPEAVAPAARAPAVDRSGP